MREALPLLIDFGDLRNAFGNGEPRAQRLRRSGAEQALDVGVELELAHVSGFGGGDTGEQAFDASVRIGVGRRGGDVEVAQRTDQLGEMRIGGGGGGVVWEAE